MLDWSIWPQSAEVKYMREKQDICKKKEEAEGHPLMTRSNCKWPIKSGGGNQDKSPTICYLQET